MSLRIGIGKNLRITPSSGITYEPELITYITGLVTPISNAQLTLLDTFIKSLKSGHGITSLSHYYDVLQIYGGENDECSLKNLAKDDHHATLVGVVPHVSLEGFTPDGVATYINTNYNPFIDGSAISTNSISFGTYQRSTVAVSTSKIHGGDEGANYLRLIPVRGLNASRVCVCNNITINSAFAGNLGLISGVRLGANEAYNVNRITYSALEATASAGLPNLNLYVGANNNNGVANSFIGTQVSLFYVAKGFTVADMTVLYNAFQAYMTANGKQI